MSLNIKIHRESGLRIELIGTIDENTVLPSFPTEKTFTIDLKAVTGLNSAGVRYFHGWGEGHPNVESIVLENCPPVVVKNFTIAYLFLKPNMKVKSVLIPYYSEQTEETMEVSFTLDDHYLSTGKLSLPQIKDSKGNDMEMDISPHLYFMFLNKIA